MKEQFVNTKLCPFFSKGFCIHGTRCSYAHSDNELRPLPDLQKTKLCDSVTKGFPCENPRCSYAHGRIELRATRDLVAFKTSLCFFHKKGRCLNGEKCRFAHGTCDIKMEDSSPTSGVEEGVKVVGSDENSSKRNISSDVSTVAKAENRVGVLGGVNAMIPVNLSEGQKVTALDAQINDQMNHQMNGSMGWEIGGQRSSQIDKQTNERASSTMIFGMDEINHNQTHRQPSPISFQMQRQQIPLTIYELGKVGLRFDGRRLSDTLEERRRQGPPTEGSTDFSPRLLERKAYSGEYSSRRHMGCNTPPTFVCSDRFHGQTIRRSNSGLLEYRSADVGRTNNKYPGCVHSSDYSTCVHGCVFHPLPFVQSVPILSPIPINHQNPMMNQISLLNSIPIYMSNAGISVLPTQQIGINENDNRISSSNLGHHCNVIKIEEYRSDKGPFKMQDDYFNRTEMHPTTTTTANRIYIPNGLVVVGEDARGPSRRGETSPRLMDLEEGGGGAFIAQEQGDGRYYNQNINKHNESSNVNYGSNNKCGSKPMITKTSTCVNDTSNSSYLQQNDTSNSSYLQLCAVGKNMNCHENRSQFVNNASPSRLIDSADEGAYISISSNRDCASLELYRKGGAVDDRELKGRTKGDSDDNYRTHKQNESNVDRSYRDNGIEIADNNNNNNNNNNINNNNNSYNSNSNSNNNDNSNKNKNNNNNNDNGDNDVGNIDSSRQYNQVSSPVSTPAYRSYPPMWECKSSRSLSGGDIESDSVTVATLTTMSDWSGLSTSTSDYSPAILDWSANRKSSSAAKPYVSSFRNCSTTNALISCCPSRLTPSKSISPHFSPPSNPISRTKGGWVALSSPRNAKDELEDEFVMRGDRRVGEGVKAWSEKHQTICHSYDECRDVRNNSFNGPIINSHRNEDEAKRREDDDRRAESSRTVAMVIGRVSFDELIRAQPTQYED